MLAKEAQEKIMRDAFYDELKKLGAVPFAYLGKLFSLMKTRGAVAGLKATNTGKFFAEAAKYKGVSAKLKYFSRYATPQNMLRKVQKVVTMPKMQTGAGTLARGFRSGVGNTAQNIRVLTSRMGAGKSIIGNIKQLGSNLKTLSGNQLRGALYKEVDITHKGVDLSKKLFKRKGILPNSKILGTTNRGTALVKKKLPLSAVFTAPGMAVTSPMLLSKDSKGKKLSMSKRLGQGVQDAALWGIAPPLGVAKELWSLTK